MLCRRCNWLRNQFIFKIKIMIQKLIGSVDPQTFFASFLFALIGVALSLLLQTTKRDVRSDNTPFAFSWKFLLKDNIRRIIAGILIIYVAIRFYPDWFGEPMTDFLALGVGLAIDKVAEIIKNRTNLLSVDRDKINQ